MKTISDIIGGAQALLDISFELRHCFEESLADDQKTFLHVLRVIEDVMPPIIRGKARTGRPPYPFKPFIRCMFAKSIFSIEKTSRLRSDPPTCAFCAVWTKFQANRRFRECSISYRSRTCLRRHTVSW